MRMKHLSSLDFRMIIQRFLLSVKISCVQNIQDTPCQLARSTELFLQRHENRTDANRSTSKCSLAQFTHSNSLTSTATCLCKVPMYFDAQMETIQTMIKMTHGKPPENVIMIRIESTLVPDRIRASENLLPEIAKREDMVVTGDAAELIFDEKDDLLQEAGKHHRKCLLYSP